MLSLYYSVKINNIKTDNDNMYNEKEYFVYKNR